MVTTRHFTLISYAMLRSRYATIRPHRLKEAIMDWKFADAQDRFSDLMNEALANGPQRVALDNQAVIVLSEHRYNELVRNQRSFIDYLLNGPDFSDLDLTRDTSSMRDIEF
jgi:hypothetical protein